MNVVFVPKMLECAYIQMNVIIGIGHRLFLLVYVHWAIAALNRAPIYFRGLMLLWQAVTCKINPPHLLHL